MSGGGKAVEIVFDDPSGLRMALALGCAVAWQSAMVRTKGGSPPVGFAKAVVPEAARNEAPAGFSLTPIGMLANLVADIARDGTPPLRRVGRHDA